MEFAAVGKHLFPADDVKCKYCAHMQKKSNPAPVRIQDFETRVLHDAARCDNCGKLIVY